MSRILTPGEAGTVGSRMMLGLLAPWREMAAIDGSATRAAERPAIQDAEDVQQRARVSIVMAARGHDAETVDAAAGCEFVDDRIRPRE
jgi:hypothetical protein